MHTNYEVTTESGLICGTYVATDEQGARDAAAVDAGYRCEADMVDQLARPSELIAVARKVEQ